MNEVPSDLGYLDAIFAAIRGFAREHEAARGWLSRAREAPVSPWRFQLLAAAHESLDRARARLRDVEAKLESLGPPDDIPAPLDRLPGNLATMRADLEAVEADFAALASSMAERPLGEG